MLPEGGFTRGEERVFTGVPAEKMGCAGVRRVVFAGFPDFVKKERAGMLDAAMQVVLDAAFFLARGRDERAEFGFEQEMLAFFGAHDHDQGDRVFGQLGGSRASQTAGGPLGGLAGF